MSLRGVGKTVLLDQMRRDADAAGLHTIRMEAPEGRSLPAMLAPELRLALLRLSRVDSAKDPAVRGLRALAGFAGKLKVSFGDIKVGLDYEPEPGLADNDDLEGDLGALLTHAAEKTICVPWRIWARDRIVRVTSRSVWVALCSLWVPCVRLS